MFKINYRWRNCKKVFFSTCYIFLANFLDGHSSFVIVSHQKQLKSTEWLLRKKPEPLECWSLNCSTTGCTHFKSNVHFGLECFKYKYFAIRIKSYLTKCFSVISVSSFPWQPTTIQKLWKNFTKSEVVMISSKYPGARFTNLTPGVNVILKSNIWT